MHFLMGHDHLYRKVMLIRYSVEFKIYWDFKIFKGKPLYSSLEELKLEFLMVLVIDQGLDLLNTTEIDIMKQHQWSVWFV